MIKIRASGSEIKNSKIYETLSRKLKQQWKSEALPRKFKSANEETDNHTTV
jgi:hypothetical protein